MKKKLLFDTVRGINQIVLIIPFLLSFIPNLRAQQESFEDISNKLFCNAFVYEKTDNATYEFLKKNFPYLTKETPKGGWIMPPEGSNSKRLIISMKFKKHPFFDFKIKEGQLDFSAVESSNIVFVKDAELWLIFKNKNDADTAFNQLIKAYEIVSDKKSMGQDSNQKVARFLGKRLNNSILKAELILTEDVVNNNYKIHFQNRYYDN